MRFVIEGMGLTAAGVKELALNLLPKFSDHPEHQFLLVYPDLPEYRALQGGNVECRLFHKPPSLLRRHWFLQRMVPRICKEFRADALLCMGNFAPSKSPCPVVVLVHNPLLIYHEPSLQERLTLREKLIVAYGRRACQKLLPRLPVIVQTEVVRDRLVSLYGFDPKRIAVIPNSCPSLSGRRDIQPRDENGESRPFTFLSISQYYPHKNFEILCDAMKIVSQRTSRQVRCVMNISPEQHPRARKLLQRVEREGLETQVVNLGWIPTRERLEQVYRSADAYILPSLMETFSFTYLEAMRFGLPVLTSDRDFARHRCRDAALYFDPLDVESVADCMLRVVNDPELRRKLIINAEVLVEQVPPWESVAAQFVAVLEQISSGGSLSREFTERHQSAVLATSDPRQLASPK